MTPRSLSPSPRRRHLQAGNPAREIRRLQRILAHMCAQHEAERRRLITRVHDDILARLVGVSLALGRTKSAARPSRGALALARADLQQAIRVAACVRCDLVPAVLDHCGWQAAIQWKAETLGHIRPAITCRVVEGPAAAAVPFPRALAIFRLFEEIASILLETCAQARVAVEVEATRSRCALRFGAGPTLACERQALTASIALQAARERAQCLGGELVVACEQRSVRLIATAKLRVGVGAKP